MPPKAKSKVPVPTTFAFTQKQPGAAPPPPAAVPAFRRALHGNAAVLRHPLHGFVLLTCDAATGRLTARALPKSGDASAAADGGASPFALSEPLQFAASD